MTDWMTRFLARFRELLTAKAADGDLTEEDLAAAMRQARSHVGGLARGEKYRAEREAATQASEEVNVLNNWPLLAGPLDLSEDGKTGRVQIFPRVGTYQHPRYGELRVTPEFLAEVKKNFEGKVYQQELPLTIDLEHQSSLSGAAGWIQNIEVDGQKGAWATVEFNDRGKSLVSADAYRYFSPEYYDKWQDPASGKEYSNVLVGGALTNRPFFKGMEPVVVAAEGLYAFTELAASEGEPVEAAVDKSVGGGVDRSKLPASDFIDSEGRRFPIVTPADVPDAVSSFGRANPAMPMDLFRRRLEAICRRKGPEFTAALPASWKEGKAATEADDPANNQGGALVGMSDEEARQFAEVQASVKTLTESLAAETAARKLAEDRALRLERDASRRALTEFVQANRAAFPTEVEVAVDRLETLQAKLTAEEFADYQAERVTLAKQLAESDLLKTKGTPGATAAGPQAEFDALVAKRMSEGLERPKAIEAVATEHPALYGRLEAEHNRRGRTGGD